MGPMPGNLSSFKIAEGQETKKYKKEKTHNHCRHKIPVKLSNRQKHNNA